MTRPETPIDKLANKWVDRLAEFSPSFATYIGYPGGETKLDSYSPADHAKVAEATRATLAELEKLAPVDAVDQVTIDAMKSSLGLDLELYEAGTYQRDMNNLASPSQSIRDIFDLSPTATEQDWHNLAERMRQVPNSLAGYIDSLREGIANKNTPALRQVEGVIEQAKQITAADGFFRKFAADAKPESGELPSSLIDELLAAAEDATAGYAAFAEFLSEELAPHTDQPDAVGRDLYQLFSRSFLGARIDLDETYEWGRAELARVISEQEKVANEILPGATIAEAFSHLESDPSRKLHGTDALQRWMQEKSDRAIAELGATHFDIPEPMRKLECMIAPTQHGGIYYTSPSDDFSRPGRMWWSVPAGVTEFDTWRELTTVYHEGVPGHHLQIGMQVYNRDQLNAWRRLASWSSGHGEGWALYAERLMDELGYLSDPADRLGMLDAQRMRAARVVLDIGVHLQKPKLTGSGSWDFEYALEFMKSNMNMAEEFVRFEVNRYFGWAGQAPAYKVGQRIWEEIRDEYKKRLGVEFDMKAFHSKALGIGGVGLDTLRRSMLG